VIKIERDPAYPFARISCVPIAGVDRHRYLLIVSGSQDMPARPESITPAEEKQKFASKRKPQ
jgi:rod shape-determining protein MreC